MVPFVVLICRPFPPKADLGKKPLAVLRYRDMIKRILDPQVVKKKLMEAPAATYTPGLLLLWEDDPEKAKKVVKEMINSKRPHPSVLNGILGGNHGYGSQEICYMHFRDRPEIAKRFCTMKFKVVCWPNGANKELTKDLVDKVHAVR